LAIEGVKIGSSENECWDLRVGRLDNWEKGEAEDVDS
jgi:hypothetical protein